MLEYVARRHYNQLEIDEKIMPAGSYNAAELSRFWHGEIDRAREEVLFFPRDKAGTCVLDRGGDLYKGDVQHLAAAMEKKSRKEDKPRSIKPRGLPATPK